MTDNIRILFVHAMLAVICYKPVGYGVWCVLQALPYVFLLIVLLFFIYAVIGMQVCK